jgi:Xaa-Pro aminopeptidase
VKKYFQDNNITVQSYSQLLPWLKNKRQAGQKIWIDPKTANAAISDCLSADMKIEKRSPIVLMKAIKNEAELNGMRQCHLRDAVAFVEFLSSLHDLLAKGNVLSEFDIDLQLTNSRAQCPQFLEPSFPTIAGVNENGAIIHYRATASGCKVLTKNDMLLLDSGGQYLDGTTGAYR